MINKKIFIYLLFLFLLLQPFCYTEAYAAGAKPAVTQEVSEIEASSGSKLSVYTHQNRRTEGMILIGIIAAGFIFMAIRKPNSKSEDRKNKTTKK